MGVRHVTQEHVYNQMRPSCSYVSGSEARRGETLWHPEYGCQYKLVTNLSLRDVCVADGKAILSTACYISTYMHSHVSCSRSIRRVNKSRLSVRIKFLVPRSAQCFLYKLKVAGNLIVFVNIL